jgi:prepilin-type N-terminal cleavage/methylation domain-containing protein
MHIPSDATPAPGASTKAGPRSSRGFTMPELLVAVGILALMAGLGVGALQSTSDSAGKVREINAGRQLVLALQASAAENGGVYLPGMDYRVGTQSNPVYKANGETVTGHAAQRYPFRLAPYLDHQFEGTILVNKNKAEIQKSAANSPGMYDYLVSVFPALGMNIFCVGGVVFSDGALRNSGACISRSASMKGSILAFASGGKGTGPNKYHGFNYVSPPTMQCASPVSQTWSPPSAWTESTDPMNFGWVDFRHDGKAVCAFLDGTVHLCDVTELADMRLWTPAAIEADDPAYSIGP